MLNVFILLIATLAFMYGMFVKRKVIMIIAALLVIGIITFDPQTLKYLAELGPQIGGPMVKIQ